ncbi:MAG: hypothetical protein H6842_02600 [Rhodospirillaceae bacterium]|nr:hypothetical protein [Rhodospirillaceae bacterium]
MPPGYSGNFTVTIGTVTEDAVSDEENTYVDNSIGRDFNFTFEVGEHVGPPTVSLGDDGEAVIKEDTETAVELRANVNDLTDTLTSITVDGFTTGWQVDLTALNAALGSDGVATFDGTTLTITFSASATVQNFVQDLLLTPPADTDVDLTDLTVTAHARDISTPSLTTDASANADIVVDAVLDQQGDVTGDALRQYDVSASDQAISLVSAFGVTLALEDTARDAGDAYAQPEDVDGADTDGSELITVTVTLTGGLTQDALVMVGTPTGTGTFNSATGEITGATAADIQEVLDLLVVNVPASFTGDIGISVTTTVEEANTPAGTVPASGAEPDTSDNTATTTSDYVLRIETGVGVPTVTLTDPEADPGIADGQPQFSEDTPRS